MRDSRRYRSHAPVAALLPTRMRQKYQGYVVTEVPASGDDKAPGSQLTFLCNIDTGGSIPGAFAKMAMLRLMALPREAAKRTEPGEEDGGGGGSGDGEEGCNGEEGGDGEEGGEGEKGSDDKSKQAGLEALKLEIRNKEAELAELRKRLPRDGREWGE